MVFSVLTVLLGICKNATLGFIRTCVRAGEAAADKINEKHGQGDG